MIHKVMQRLSEPSTWAGLSGLAVIFGLSASEWQAWANALAGVCALVAMITQERGSASKPADSGAPLGRTRPDEDDRH